MYLSNIKLWNFRKFGSESFDIKEPNLDLNFQKGLNVLIGENDSGKTAIIDAIKIVLKTHSYEWIRVTEDDFYSNSDRLRIELIFKDLEDDQAKYFTEWLSWEKEGKELKPFLRLIYDVSKTPERILPSDVRGGNDEDGYPISAEARYYLKTTYLKPLRNAEVELIPKRYSRLSQILENHEAFEVEEEHLLYKSQKDFNKAISNYFEGKDKNGNDLKEDKNGKKIKNKINNFIKGFYNKSSGVEFKTSDANLKRILEKLKLSIINEEYPGLGTLNRLFMAVELLHLEKEDWDGLKLGLIEEIEAHLHPQVQMKVIQTLQNQEDIQLILTTHSPNLASKVKLKNLILCKDRNAFPMGYEYTELFREDYKFLEKFLDVTKSNLFFARGLILVEGWSEEILLPMIARIVGYDLTENEVSVINVGNLGFSNYYKVFLRQDESHLNIPISVITDVDITEYSEEDNEELKKLDINEYDEKCSANKIRIENRIKIYKSKTENEVSQGIIKPFVAPEWTLEWCLYKSKSLKEVFKSTVKEVHPTIFNESINFEEELAKRLLPGSKKIKKTEIAYKIAQKLEDENIDIKTIKEDDTINYLVEAIKYACR